MNREQWLLNSIQILRDELFKQHGAEVPMLKVSIGFPGGGSPKKRIGEYWKARATSDGIPQVFISPVHDNSLEILGTLVHELIHAVYPEAGHKGPFKALALAVGLEGPMRSTKASQGLIERFKGIVNRLGEIPSGRIDLSQRKKQTTRLVKLECPTCGYVVRTAQKWIDTIGYPQCSCSGTEFQGA